MTVEIFDDRVCELGEGPLWHPEREQLYWFDIPGCRLLTRGADGPREWRFDGNVSAAGWVDRDRLLIASERELFLFDLETGARDHVAPLEADNPATRSNDGRADPYGGFWIGTMGKEITPKAGAIYRYYKGRVEKLYDDITVPNAICFTPDGKAAYYVDGRAYMIMRQPLDDEGWPKGAPELFVDLREDRQIADGAVVDAAGNFWNARFRGARVVCHAPDGRVLRVIDFPAQKTTCPAFGGPGLSTLYMTSAAIELEQDGRQGLTYSVGVDAVGQKEHRVLL